MISLTLYLITLFPIIAFCAVVIFWRLFVHPKAKHLKIRDALILAAHPDDCVIVAGEYGIESLKAGNTVTIVCMTCGDIDADSAYAKTRRSEMLLAWSKAKLPPENIIFIDAPESKMNGPANQDDVCKVQIELNILNAILNLPIKSVIIMPAAGESHIDHRTLRKLAINAILASQRHDVEIYESPEYSNYCSLICNPFGTIKNLLRLVPGGRHIAKHINVDMLYPHYATFRFGAWRLAFDEQRFNLKCEMLISFKSQGSEIMVKYFGRPDVYRRLNVGRSQFEDDLPRGIKLKGAVYSRLTIACVISIFISIISFISILAIKFALPEICLYTEI